MVKMHPNAPFYSKLSGLPGGGGGGGVPPDPQKAQPYGAH